MEIIQLIAARAVSDFAGAVGILEVWGDLVALLVFKTSVGLNKVPGGFDSHPPPPI